MAWWQQNQQEQKKRRENQRLMKWGQTHIGCFSSKVKTVSQATVTQTLPS
jgi:hypothetical protein